jgi:hypothetical protein
MGFEGKHPAIHKNKMLTIRLAFREVPGAVIKIYNSIKSSKIILSPNNICISACYKINN